MKYIKLLMLLAVVTFFGACSSDDESWNTASDVAVNMKNSDMIVKENVGLFNVPIVVSGETNGNVFVTVEVKEVSEDGTIPAQEDVNYYVTDKTIEISDGVGNVEIESVDDDDVNDNRIFEVTIVDVKGAKLGETVSTKVTLKDNDAEFYDKLQGSWTLTCIENDAPVSRNIKISGATDENDPDYNKYLYVSGIYGYEWIVAILDYHYDPATKNGYVSFDHLGQYAMAEDVNFGSFSGSIVPYSIEGNKLSANPIIGTWSADFKSITFDQDATLYGAVFSGDNYMGGIFDMTEIKFTKK